MVRPAHEIWKDGRENLLSPSRSPVFFAISGLPSIVSVFGHNFALSVPRPSLEPLLRHPTPWAADEAGGEQTPHILGPPSRVCGRHVCPHAVCLVTFFGVTALRAGSGCRPDDDTHRP